MNARFGGAEGIRTPDLLSAIQALSQLSYSPSGTSLSHNRGGMGPFSGGGDPERQANIAFMLIFLGIVFVGGLTIWLFYGAQF